MLQLIRAILKDPEDPTHCFLLFANQVAPLFSVLGFHSYCVGMVVPGGRLAQPLPRAPLHVEGPPHSKQDRALSQIPPLAPEGRGRENISRVQRLAP